ncbi:MAG: hypothetical protein QOH11_345 [Solirubrobacteraceae bacterium]|jgi:hypothetical protein|nr:hypothetical protein [Solirubrobacteraceae bacterium]
MRPRVVIVAALIVLSGCGVGSRGGVATNNVSACAAALPLARDTLGQHGTLVRVHRLRRGQAAAVLRALGRPLSTRPPRPPNRKPPGREPKRCLIVYRGPYRQGSVPRARSEHGRYAVVIAKARHPALVAVVLTDRLPPSVRR